MFSAALYATGNGRNWRELLEVREVMEAMHCVLEAMLCVFWMPEAVDVMFNVLLLR